MSKKIIYVLYAPGGNNHRSMAQMIEETFKRRYPQHTVILEDVSKTIANKTLKFIFSVYDNLLIINPRLAKYAFNMVDLVKTDKPLVPVFPGIVNRLATRIKAVKPDVIISVHSGINFFIAAALKQMQAEPKIPFTILCTELCGSPLLKSWVYPEVDLMFGLLEPGRQEFLNLGVPPEKIKMMGGPIVNPRFQDFSLAKTEARKKFGLKEDVFTIMIMSGGIGLTANYHFTKQLISSKLPVQILVCTGRNEKLKLKLDKLAKNADNVKVFGFTDQIPNMMDAADLMVTKPGPASLSEAIIKELPIILDQISCVMPQESGNVKYITEQGLGKKVTQLSEFQNLISSLIFNPEELSAMKGNMRRVKQDESAGKLADYLLTIAEGRIGELTGLVNNNSRGTGTLFSEIPKMKN
jgi:UDP-N-acetylglucosamine:LPS N-acetylglucosamine transferase